MTNDQSTRQPPRGIGRWFARAPRYLYRVHLGWLLGKRFVLLEHTGRQSGLSRQTVLEVIHSNPTSVYVAAAWGRQSDWFRNVQATPDVLVSNGRRRSSRATATVLAETSAVAIFERYYVEHRVASQGLARVFDLPFGDAHAMAATVPIVQLTFARS